MADETGEDVAKSGDGGKNKLMLILVVINILAVTGLGAYLVLFHQGPQSAEAEEPEPEPTEFGPLVPLDAMVSNLAGSNGKKFIKVTMHLEVGDPDKQPVLEAALVPVRNRFLLHLSSLTAEQVDSSEKMEALRGKLAELANKELGEEVVRRVFFTEFIAQ